MSALAALVRGHVPDDIPLFRRRGENDDGTPPIERLARATLAEFHAEFRHLVETSIASTRHQAETIARARALNPNKVFALLHASFAASCDAHDPLTRFARTFGELFLVVQGTARLKPRCTLSANDRLAGDFELGRIRHDGRWHLTVQNGRARLMAIDVGRRLARSIGKNAIEIHTTLTCGARHAAAGLRDLTIAELASGYRVSARTRAIPYVSASIHVARSGIVDWSSALEVSAQAARRARRAVLFDSTVGDKEITDWSELAS
ncbi:MAG: hypothetical protein H7Z43_10915 [Clostridia bacterium]|nr:hypothetical protein [Deltaproteobacteria bacterium]